MALVKYNNNSISAVTSASSMSSGAMTLIKTLTASSSSTLSFVDGSNGVVLDSTYPIYKFEFINIHPSSDNVNFQFNLSTDSGSNYNVTKTSTSFRARQTESGTNASIGYNSDFDLAQGTGDQPLLPRIGNDNDQCGSGYLHLFNPSSNTFVKHWVSRFSFNTYDNYERDEFISGYGNTSSPINSVRFAMSSGNIDSGKIKLYGIKDS